MHSSRGSGGCGRGRPFRTERRDNFDRRPYRDDSSGGGREGFRGGRELSAGSIGEGQFLRGAQNRKGRGGGPFNERNVAGRPDGFQNREGGSGNGRRDDTPKVMTYGRLKAWAETEDAGELVLFMSTQKQQIETFLNQTTIKPDWMTFLVKAANHAITAQHQKESIKQLLDNLCKTRFFEHFATYIEEKQLLGLYWPDGDEFFKSLLNIMEEILNKLPQYAVKCVSGASRLLNVDPSLEPIHNNQVLRDAIIDFSKRAKEVYLEEKEKEKRPSGGKFLGSGESDKPPDNYADLSVVPTRFDLNEDAKPFLRRAKTVGGYESVDDYLDVQFRLMRQDFVTPLREGIIEFKRNGCKKNYICSDLRMYFDVHITGILFKNGIDHILQFDISKLKNVKWEFSKRLIFGSLLCLSKDNFETVLFATVAYRDVKNLAKGTVNVSFKTGLDEVFNATSNDVYVMAETTAYFESYCHVLEGLKEMSKTLPLQDYIIKCKTELRPPRYLLPSNRVSGIPKYDLSPLMKSEAKAKTEVAVLTTVNWPAEDDMCLNKSQRDAAMLALTKELAVIQGPPGTGKTYVGLKVMQVLIENMGSISEDEGKGGPILVVCYTNHALDQFLEGVLEFCSDGVVRVGGKSSSEKLQQFNIKNLRDKIRKDKSFSSLSVRRSISECLQEMVEVSDKITNLTKINDFLEVDVMPEMVLENFMKDTHFQSLRSRISQPGQKVAMRNWLNTSNKTFQSLVPQVIQKQLTKFVLQWREVSFDFTLTPDMTIFQRTNFYHICLEMYRQNLMKELSFLSRQPNYYVSRIQEINMWLSFSISTILPDAELERVIPEEVIGKMYSFLRSSRRLSEDSKGAIIKTWLLGLHKDFHSQLDDLQRLKNVLSGEKLSFETFDDPEASEQAQNDRIIDDDDGYGAKNYNAKNQVAMDNISSVIHRVNMLSINENVWIDEENEDGDDGEWKTVSHSKPMSFIKFQKKLKAVKPMTKEMEDSISNVWDLNDHDQRFALYKLWIERYKKTLTKQMQELVNRYTSAFERKIEISREETLFLLRSAKVIGMTTTGAAKHRAVLQSVGCKIIVVEEAAEVLESHIVTALNKNCKHLILIGDHQQLRPNPTVYILAKEYGLEISLFERLIKNKVPHVLLKEQHRMRPEISKIMCHIYPSLQDHTSVRSYDHIRGVTKDIFFIQHEEIESHVDDTRSRSNIHEASFLVALCQYLLHQGYDESEITILATYTGQVFAIKKIMKEVQFNHRVRVTAVDNFQGEENQIILLSLVRSNTENNVGFLKVDNRVCVALSRAKKGLFVSGNFNILASQSKLWKNIVETMKLEQAIGGGLPVACQKHPEFQKIMTCAEDFKNCPDGGCGRPCDDRLKCGHVCGRKCHGYDVQHEDFQCRKNCAKKCANDHPCQQKCYQVCGDCMVKVTKVIPVCGHEDNVACSVPTTKAECSQKCSSMLVCEHPCPGSCGKCKKNNRHEKCLVPVTYSWPCGHDATVSCYMNPSQFSCQKLCGADLDCGHKCIGKCSDCLQGSIHVACGEKCHKKLPCGHLCPSFCGVPCLPCTQLCPAQCRHAACYKANHPCSHACPPCMEPCLYKCTHGKCNKLCSDVCDVELCLERCKRKMKCGHACSGLCGELCVCAKCEKISSLHETNNDKEILIHDVKDSTTHKKDSIAAATVSNESCDQTTELKPKSRSDIQKLIIKVPSCNHIFYVDELDKFVKNFDPDGTSFIFCPVCPKPILKCRHFESVNKLRNRAREAEKNKLLMATNVTKKQKSDLLMSQKRLEDSAFLGGFHSEDVSQVKNQTEVQAMSFKLKCAFILSEISSLIENNSSPSQLLKSQKDLILRINQRLTSQQKSEFTTELLRNFWFYYLTHLESLSSRHDIDVPQAMNTTIKVTIQGLKKLKPSGDMLERGQHVCDILRRRIMEMSSEEVVKAKCLLLQQASARTIKIMESRDEDMLCDLFGDGKETKPRSSLATQDVSKNIGTRFKDTERSASRNLFAQREAMDVTAHLRTLGLTKTTRSRNVLGFDTDEKAFSGFKDTERSASRNLFANRSQREIKDVTGGLRTLGVTKTTKSHNILDFDDSDTDEEAVSGLKATQRPASRNLFTVNSLRKETKDTTTGLRTLGLTKTTQSRNVLGSDTDEKVLSRFKDTERSASRNLFANRSQREIKDVTGGLRTLGVTKTTKSHNILDFDDSDTDEEAVSGFQATERPASRNLFTVNRLHKETKDVTVRVQTLTYTDSSSDSDYFLT